MNYGKAPYYNEVYPLVEKAVEMMEGNLAKYLQKTILDVFEFLEIDTKIIISSELDKDNSLHAQDKVIDICKRLNGDVYFNPIGGVELYNCEDFLRNGISLKFLKMNDIRYQQFDDEFVPGLSIIDVMMFNDKKTIKNYLNQYTLL